MGGGRRGVTVRQGGRRGRRGVRARHGGWGGRVEGKRLQRERDFQESIGNSLTVMHIWCVCFRV